MKRTITLILAGGLLLAGCAEGDADVGIEMTSAREAGVTDAEFPDEIDTVAAEEADEPSAVPVNLEATQNRQVIRQASLELHASDTRKAYAEIVAVVESAGGFVAHANVAPTSGEDNQPRVSMTLRVPAAQLNTTMSAIKDSVDEVVSESQGAEDVTEQYVDLQARLTNLEALEVELRALLEEVRQQPGADPEKLLTVFRELSATRGQIEQIQGRINHLNDMTSLATLQVQLTQTPLAVPLVETPWTPAEAARDAVRGLVTGMQGVADWAIGFVLYTLPMMLLTLGPLVLVGVFVYRKWFRRPPTDPAPAES